MTTPTPASTSAAGLAATTAAVAAKTLRVFGRTPQLAAATVGQGVLFLLVFRYVFGGAIDTGAFGYVDYMAAGILTAAILFAAAGAAVGVAHDRVEGFTDRVLSLPTSRSGLVLGRTLADTAVVIAANLATLLAAVAVGFRPDASVTQLAAAAGLLGLYAFAFAALFGALGSLADGPQAAQTFGFLAIPLTFVSSAYVPTDTMPAWLAAVADHQPVTVMIEALRGLLHAGVVGAHPNTVLLAATYAAGIASAGLLVARYRLAGPVGGGRR